MTTKIPTSPPPPRVYRSGHCGLGAPEEAHLRCRGEYAGALCRGECHTECPACGRSGAA